MNSRISMKVAWDRYEEANLRNSEISQATAHMLKRVYMLGAYTALTRLNLNVCDVFGSDKDEATEEEAMKFMALVLNRYNDLDYELQLLGAEQDVGVRKWLLN